MRRTRAAGAMCVLLLAACGSSSATRAASTSSLATTSTSGVPTTTTSAPTTTTAPPTGTTIALAPGFIAKPRAFATPTFIQWDGTGRLSVVRLSDGKEVQLLRSPIRQEATWAMRAPNGDLLVVECNLPTCGMGSDGPYVHTWRDLSTGTTFAGNVAAVSPDGTRFAAVIIGTDYQTFVRQYDFGTGQVLSDLHAEGNYAITNFNWTDDSQSLFVAVSNDLYVVDRDAGQLPQTPNVPNGLVEGDAKVLTNPAMLANGHVVAFESYGIQRPHTNGALVDIAPTTSAHHVVVGTISVAYASIAVRGNQALVSDTEGRISLYDGKTVRFIRTAGPFTGPMW